MDDLKYYQQSLLGVLKKEQFPDQDYFQLLRDSKGYKTISYVVRSWRMLQLQSRWPISVAYLKKYGDLEADVDEVYEKSSISAYLEEVAQLFSELWLESEDELFKLVHLFEKNLVELRRGKDVDVKLIWPMEPMGFIGSLISNKKVEDFGAMYSMRISTNINNHIEVNPISHDH